MVGFLISQLLHQELSEEFSSERDSLSYKQLMEQLKVRLDYVWLSAHSPSVSRFWIIYILYTARNMCSVKCVQDQPCIWGAGGAAFSLPHHVHRLQRFALRRFFILHFQGGIFSPFGVLWRRTQSTRRIISLTCLIELPTPKVRKTKYLP